ncbi:unnamed protein product [Hydatigera taeniaeformis]|uniref:PRORP domain-containing protein n=1 Tax=Hydatigena taeniaeformis TaxID=6205 RepID=A0A0R3X5U2_HYDTA|nr:unnamed protein product [Hydatigera taeniaeformis]
MAGVLRFFRGVTKLCSIRGVSENVCLRYTHFSAAAAMSSFQHIDAYFKLLDNSFLEFSHLQAMYELLESPSIDPYFKMNFWSKFVLTSLACGKDKIVNSLILFILERSDCHSIATLITVLKALALQKRFKEFESLYALVMSRLSPTDVYVYAADVSAALCLTPFYKEARGFLHMNFERKVPIETFGHFLSAAAIYGPLDEVISFIYELHSMGLNPTQDFYPAFIKRLQGDEGMHYMTSLLEAISSCQCILSSSTALLLKDWFENHGWRGTMGVTLTGSNDDAFMIYLALWSGPNCYLFSNDEFRQHRFTLGTDASPLLARWQAARQISMRSTRPLIFLGPALCDPTIQGSMTEGWHIPYESGGQRPSYLPSNTWLCLRP